MVCLVFALHYAGIGGDYVGDGVDVGAGGFSEGGQNLAADCGWLCRAILLDAVARLGGGACVKFTGDRSQVCRWLDFGGLLPGRYGVQRRLLFGAEQCGVVRFDDDGEHLCSHRAHAAAHQVVGW